MENAGRVQRERIASRVSGGRVCRAHQAYTCVSARRAVRSLHCECIYQYVVVSRLATKERRLPSPDLDARQSVWCVCLSSFSLCLYIYIYLFIYLSICYVHARLSLSLSLSLSTFIYLLSRTLLFLPFSSSFSFPAVCLPFSFVDLTPLRIVASTRSIQTLRNVPSSELT